MLYSISEKKKREGKVKTTGREVGIELRARASGGGCVEADSLVASKAVTLVVVTTAVTLYC